MDENILRQVEERLKAKFYTTNDEWLSEGIEYYLSKHKNYSFAEVLEFVISQWQLSDLRVISNQKPCLPKNLAAEKCTLLRGNFILQMEKVYDISESKYKQFEKIRNLSNDNIEITDGEKTQTAWEPKKKRMLYLHLTDGSENVVAIEYKPIRFLNDSLLPGYKLLIKGPVTCRRGVIMLDETNISEIGGEVDNLLIPNALENVLARALNLPENPDPYDDNGKTKEQDKNNDDIEDALFNDDFDIDMEDVATIERQSQEAAQIPPNLPSNQTNFTVSTDQQTNRPATLDPERREPPPVLLNSRSESDLFFDTIDDIIFDEMELNLHKPSDSSHTSCRTKNAVPARNLNLPDENKSLTKKETTKESEFGNIGAVAKSRTIREFSPPLCLDARFNIQATNNLAKLRIDNKNCESATASSPRRLGTERNPATKNSSPVHTAGSKRPAAVLSSPNINSPAEKMHCPDTAARVSKTVKNNRKITDYMTKGESSKPIIKAPKLYDSICDVLAVNITDTIIYKKISGKVTKFDKLSKDGQCWKLNATITDNTGSIETAFSSEILESMLGFSATEFSLKKKLKKTDPEMENYLRQGFRGAEKKLMNLDGLLRVELAPTKKPKIVEIISKEK